MKAQPRRPAEPGPDELLFVPLGGTGEIGMNLNLYGHAGKWLMVDCGVAFGEHDLPGIEVVLPDPDFVFERKDDLAGILLTHAHEDHLGALPYVWPQLDCPVYATPFTAALLRRKLRDDGVELPAELIEVPLSGRLSIGPFELELVTLTHSIPEPNAVLIHTACGTVFHTGDWKLDEDPLVGESYDVERLRRLADEGVLAMICDSTNALVPGTAGSELEVREALEKTIGGLSGRVAVACFASNVARLETVMAVAEAQGRRVALVGRSMHRIVAAAREAGYLQDMAPLVDVRDLGYLPPEETLLLCTGSQGEPRAALWRIANDDHPDVTLSEGDSVVFSSRVIPGNEKAIFALYNALSRRGVKVISDKEAPGIHVSGHPCRDELTQMYQWVRPRIAVPVHGEARHMAAQAELARACQVPEVVLAENGAVVRLAPGKADIVDHVHAGRMVVDGTAIRSTDSPVLRQRRRMVREGSAVVAVVVDEHGDLLGEPRIAGAGLYDSEQDADIEDAAIDAAEEAVHRASRKERRDDAALSEAVRLAVRRTFQRELGRKPVVEVQLIRLED